MGDSAESGLRCRAPTRAAQGRASPDDTQSLVAGAPRNEYPLPAMADPACAQPRAQYDIEFPSLDSARPWRGGKHGDRRRAEQRPGAPATGATPSTAGPAGAEEVNSSKWPAAGNRAPPPHDRDSPASQAGAASAMVLTEEAGVAKGGSPSTHAMNRVAHHPPEMMNNSYRDTAPPAASAG